jgi:hypothetical protein
MSEIRDLIMSFSAQLTAEIQAQVLAQTRMAVMNALGVSPSRGPGRPPKPQRAIGLVRPSAFAKTRKKPPRQLCPVPGCKNTAAPIFGMVCAKHKDVAKSKIKKYREARKAKKLKAAT